MVLEAAAAGLAGVVIWGLHRDTVDIRAIGLPVFSMGAIPTGPLRPGSRPPDALDVGHGRRLAGQPATTWCSAMTTACCSCRLARAEQRSSPSPRGSATPSAAQADRMRGGVSLREQVRFGDYLAARSKNPSLTFREHLRSVSGAIEE